MFSTLAGRSRFAAHGALIPADRFWECDRPKRRLVGRPPERQCGIDCLGATERRLAVRTRVTGLAIRLSIRVMTSARQAWVTSRADERGEVERVSGLVGHAIVGVRYFDIGYPGRPPRAWDGRDFHVLDFGLEWDLDDGSVWSFVWQVAGLYEALLVYNGLMAEDQASAAGQFDVATVTDQPEWAAVVGRPIVSVDSYWETWDDMRCPVSWAIRLDGGSWVAATLGTREADGDFRPSHDDVAVFFDRAVATRYGVPL